MLRTANTAPVWRGETLCFFTRYDGKNGMDVSAALYQAAAGPEGLLAVVDCNRNGSGLQSAHVQDHIRGYGIVAVGGDEGALSG